MTVKQYYQNAYMREFHTYIQEQKQDESGWYVVLEETAFYPTGGGQPYDTGTLKDKRIINVEEVNGEIRHYIEEPFEDISGVVDGEIDWERRFDHMQQHAGQHILSAAFAETLQYETISFHLGKEFLTIDLNVSDISNSDASKAEELANRIIREARPIEAKWVTEADLSDYPLRKQPSVTDEIRLVIIPEFDYNGCGGTHPRSTSEVGAIKILDWEKHKGHIRLQFVCGDRVLHQLHRKHGLLKELTSVLQAPEETMVSTAVQLISKQKEQEKALEGLKEVLLTYEAEGLIGVHKDDYTLIRKAYSDRPIQELQKIAQHIISKREDAIVMLVVHNDQKLQLVAAKGSLPTINLREVAQKVFPLINGKGGGKESFVQGGGEAVMSKEELLEALIKQL
ncbi:alanyl-tRNA synthetase [Bacillus sp. V-88]|uniref:serine-tRNA(Ala) deacylase AlaX n=1 Tax=Rossellomorea vietnamensis TaxID=218284 RepID=UPI0005547B31|nr:serine-tRNA(Ala) deacylase AlaX [Rossellomorea vietnamensis]OXS54126.1 serine-tRNA(Ala) deacylase AlaX [Bacillus sp. DSM 27956]PRX64627.1 alanyl-tRNA synthetase [Bacillus sp. V-88]SLK25019.1 alanyl-tRNA synthetase [Bacillus sp. V-88]